MRSPIVFLSYLLPTGLRTRPRHTGYDVRSKMADEVEFVSDEDIPRVHRVRRKDIFTSTVCLIFILL